MERAAKGQKPGGTLGRQVTIVADADRSSPQNQTVTLEGSEGQHSDLVVEDLETDRGNIKRAIRWKPCAAEALAISVEPAMSRK